MALPQRARIIVVGGGIVGCSTAYHLARLGEKDVLLLEQGAAHLRHHLACGRPGRPDAPEPQHDADEQVRHRALCDARSRDGPGDRLEGLRQRQRRAHARAHAGAAPATGAGAQLRRRLRGDRRGPRRRAVPGDAQRRSARRDLDPRRRQGQPGRPDDVAGQGRAAARRAHRRGRRGGRREDRGGRRKARASPAFAFATTATSATSNAKRSSTAPASGPASSASSPA